MKVKIFFIASAFILASILSACAQTNGAGVVLHFKIKTSDEKGVNLTGVSLKLFRDTLAAVEAQTSAPDDWLKTDGSANLTMEVNKRYTISFSKQGYVSYMVLLDTHMPSGEKQNAKSSYDLDLKMYKEDTHPGLMHIDFPLALIQYSSKEDKFISNTKYAAGIISRMKSN